MGRPLNVCDGDDLMRVIRERNVICSTKFLDALIKHHGAAEEEPEVEEGEEETPQDPEPEPEPIVMLPATFPALHKVEVIKRAVCRQFNIPTKLVESATRKANAVRPRQIAMYLVRKHTDHSYAEIGRRLGGRDHSTILHAYRKISQARMTDADLDDDLRGLEALIQ